MLKTWAGTLFSLFLYTILRRANEHNGRSPVTQCTFSIKVSLRISLFRCDNMMSFAFSSELEVTHKAVNDTSYLDQQT
jgi:hypothetical protein